MIVEIPVYPHVKKLLLYNVLDPEKPLKAEFHNRLGLTIRAILHSKAEKSSANDRMTELLKVEINDNISNMDHRLKRLVKINDYFDKDFKEIMMHSIRDQMHSGIPALQATKNFLRRIGVTESEYSYESAYRAWLREKNFEYEKQKHSKKRQLRPKIKAVAS